MTQFQKRTNVLALRHKPCCSRVTDGPSQPRSARTARAPVSPRRLPVNAPLSPVQGGPPPSLSKAAVPMRLRQPTASPRGPDRTAPRVAGLPPAPNLVRSRKRVENNDATCVWRRRLPSTLTTKRPSVISHARAINNAAKEVLVTVVYSCFFLASNSQAAVSCPPRSRSPSIPRENRPSPPLSCKCFLVKDDSVVEKKRRKRKTNPKVAMQQRSEEVETKGQPKKNMRLRKNDSFVCSRPVRRVPI